MLTGKKAFDNMSDNQLLQFFTKGKTLELPTKILEAASKDAILAGLLRIMRDCHKYNPAERPHAKDIVNELDAILVK